MMRIKKLLSFVLCVTLLFNLSSPIVHASDIECVVVEDVMTGDGFAAYVYENEFYRYSIVVNTETATGSFAIMYFTNEDYVYEYIFTLGSESICVDSAVFWNRLLSECMSASSSWNEIYLPTAVIAQKNINDNIATFSVDNVEDGFIALLEEHFDTTEYTGEIIATKFYGGTRFHVHETLEFRVTEKDNYFIANALSVASFITGVLGFPVTSTILAALGLTATAFIPDGTEIGTHSIGAVFVRYVRIADRSAWMNSCNCVYEFIGYYLSSTNHYGVDWGSETVVYSHSEDYFNDMEQQFEDGYDYYCTEFRVNT